MAAISWLNVDFIIYKRIIPWDAEAEKANGWSEESAELLDQAGVVAKTVGGAGDYVRLCWIDIFVQN